MNSAELLAACIEAEPALVEIERLINKALPGGEPFRLRALTTVRAAIANATRCNEQECCYFGKQRSPSCGCAREAA